MIAKVHFEGIIKEGKKKSTRPDTVQIHIPPGDLNQGKVIFERWIEGPSLGIRGDSGVFHPLQGLGTIKVGKVEEGK